jgi:NAD(P)-dependent dehydrogenase (short-subunit alcohol dehydrogenase family)
MTTQPRDSVALVTGGNRGIGRAFVNALLAEGASKVYAAVRDPADVDSELLAAGVVAVPLDVTDPAAVAAAAKSCHDVTVLINNAGFHSRERLILTDDPAAARQEMEVNYFGVLTMTREFAPVLAANGGGAIVNVLSVAGSIPIAFMGGYSPAKSAALFLSTIARAELEPQGTTVTALIVGAVRTRMSDYVDGAMEDPAAIAQVGLQAMSRGDRTVDTDAMATHIRALYALDPVRYERGIAKMLNLEKLNTKR